MFALVFSGFVLVAATMFIHAGGIGIVVRPLTKIHDPRMPTTFWQVTLILLRMTWWMILLHVVEITIWAVFFWWRGCFPTVRESFYFSGVTYTTVGYGDLVLAPPWRLLAPVESLIGVLMCGLSTGFFFVVMTQLHNLRQMQITTLGQDNKT